MDSKYAIYYISGFVQKMSGPTQRFSSYVQVAGSEICCIFLHYHTHESYIASNIPPAQPSGWEAKAGLSPLNVVSVNKADCHSPRISHISFYPSHLSVRPAKTTCIKVRMMLVETIIATSQNVQYCRVSRRSRSSSFQLLGLTAFNFFTSSLILSPKMGNSRSA